MSTSGSPRPSWLAAGGELDGVAPELDSGRVERQPRAGATPSRRAAPASCRPAWSLRLALAPPPLSWAARAKSRRASARGRSRSLRKCLHSDRLREAGEELRPGAGRCRPWRGPRRPHRGARRAAARRSAGPVPPALLLRATEARASRHRGERCASKRGDPAHPRAPGPASAAALRLAPCGPASPPPVRGAERQAARRAPRRGRSPACSPAPARPGSARRRSGCAVGRASSAPSTESARAAVPRAAAPRSSCRSRL